MYFVNRYSLQEVKLLRLYFKKAKQVCFIIFLQKCILEPVTPMTPICPAKQWGFVRMTFKSFAGISFNYSHY